VRRGCCARWRTRGWLPQPASAPTACCATACHGGSGLHGWSGMRVLSCWAPGLASGRPSSQRALNPLRRMAAAPLAHAPKRPMRCRWRCCSCHAHAAAAAAAPRPHAAAHGPHAARPRAPTPAPLPPQRCSAKRASPPRAAAAAPAAAARRACRHPRRRHLHTCRARRWRPAAPLTSCQRRRRRAAGPDGRRAGGRPASSPLRGGGGTGRCGAARRVAARSGRAARSGGQRVQGGLLGARGRLPAPAAAPRTCHGGPRAPRAACRKAGRSGGHALCPPASLYGMLGSWRPLLVA
jgi:hypothetical protein